MKEAKIIEFNRPAEFYFRAAQKMTETSNYLGALSMMRKALEKDESNVDYIMQMAEILTELGKYEESNSLLFDLLLHSEERQNECFFGMGCNFIGLNDFEKAQESFERYIEEEPEGEFSEDIEEFLAFFDDAMEYEELLLEDVRERENQKLAQDGKRLLDNGEYEQAAVTLEKIETADPGLLYAKNNLALSYYCMGKLEKAVDITKLVLLEEPDNTHANCNMALFMTEKGDAAKADEYMKKTLAQQPLEQDDMFKVAITLCELKRHELALKYLVNYLALNPYDEKALYFAAVACFNMKRYADAVRYLSNITKLTPQDSIATYYIGYVKDTMEGRRPHAELTYIYQVPPAEARQRMKYLNDCMKLPDRMFHELWKNDKRLNDIMLWGLEYGDLFIKRAVAEIIGNFGDEKAERVLRRYILRRGQPDEVKNDIFILLKRMHAQEPYVAHFNGGIVEVKVGLLDPDQEAMAEEYTNLFDLIVTTVSDSYSETLAGKAVSLLQKYNDAAGRDDSFLGDIKEFAAAITFVTLYLSGKTEEPRIVAQLYDADKEKMSEMIVSIMNALDQKEE